MCILRCLGTCGVGVGAAALLAQGDGALDPGQRVQGQQLQHADEVPGAEALLQRAAQLGERRRRRPRTWGGIRTLCSTGGRLTARCSRLSSPSTSTCKPHSASPGWDYRRGVTLRTTSAES